MTIVAIHQPPYLAWLGLLEKIALCDRFVVLDTVQYNARAFQHRTLYSTDTGPKYLSLSVRRKGHRAEGTALKEIELADADVPKKHFETLRHRYGKRPGWSHVGAALEPILLEPPGALVPLNVSLLHASLSLFGIETEVLHASSVTAEGAKSALMAGLTEAVGGTSYLSGSGARAYLCPDEFAERGLGLYWQSFEHPVYPQSHAGEFQDGCFGLEWIIEDPQNAVRDFHAHVADAARRIALPDC